MRLCTSVLLLLGLTGCSWVTDADFEQRLQEVDDDGDGVAASEDCDDNDPTISPALAETWYDGIDQDCAGGDDYDQDNDGFVADEHLGKATAGVAGTGALPGGDCDDTEPRVSPQQPDTWYDGKDQDCDGADDYDQDGDGFVADEYAGLTTLYVDGSGTLPGGDCDDLLDTVTPDSADDWYDGVDTNCDGADDWDQDGDGYVAKELYADYGPTTYAPGTGNLPNGDCDDERDWVYPGAPDEWYDGRDADCAGNDDYDQDGDGYASPLGAGSDCDDEDGEIYPGGRETLGDDADGDCDGGRDTFALDAIAGFTWADPHAPVFDESSDRIYLSIAAAEIDSGSTRYYDSAVALLWLNGDPGDGRDGVAAWSARTSDPADYDVGPGQGFVATDDYIYGAIGWDYGDSRALQLTRYDVSTGARAAALASGEDGLTAYDDISVVLDVDGAFHVAACDDSAEVLHYVRLPPSFSGGFDADEEIAGVRAADCALDVRGGVGTVFTSERGTIWSYTFDPSARTPTFEAAEFDAAYAPLDIDIPADWAERVLVLADATSDGVVLLDADGATRIAEGELPLEVDVFEDADGTLYVAYVTPGGDAHLAWGRPDTGYTTIELAAAFAVEDVAVWASGGYLLYGVTGPNDVAVGIARL